TKFWLVRKQVNALIIGQKIAMDTLQALRSLPVTKTKLANLHCNIYVRSIHRQRFVFISILYLRKLPMSRSAKSLNSLAWSREPRGLPRSIGPGLITIAPSLP